MTEQHLEAGRDRDHVVVHQPDAVVPGVVRLPDAEVEAARSPEVVLAVGDAQREVVADQHVPGVVGAGVVDHEDRVDRAGLDGQPVEHPRQQVGAVVGDDDDGHALGHPRNLWCPVKSPRRPARIASALSRTRATDGFVSV